MYGYHSTRDILARCVPWSCSTTEYEICQLALYLRNIFVTKISSCRVYTMYPKSKESTDVGVNWIRIHMFRMYLLAPLVHVYILLKQKCGAFVPCMIYEKIETQFKHIDFEYWVF